MARRDFHPLKALSCTRRLDGRPLRPQLGAGSTSTTSPRTIALTQYPVPGSLVLMLPAGTVSIFSLFLFLFINLALPRLVAVRGSRLCIRLRHPAYMYRSIYCADSRLSRGCLAAVSRLSRGCLAAVSRRFAAVSRVSRIRGCLAAVSRLSRGCESVQ